MQTPVLLIIFNRPDCTARVLDAISKAKPKQLFVVADGPRPDHPDDIERCRATRELVAALDWDCDIRTNYSDVNLGCKLRPESGINWVFEQVEEAIILEDDCIPDPSFFIFCEELLGRYRDDERIMMIGGYNFYDSDLEPTQSYYFSYLASTWGWATWRRAWRLNDPELKNWPKVVESRLIENLFPDPIHTRFWYDVFDAILSGRQTDAWDYQWQLACWFNSGYRIFPAVSLVSNIGFGDDSTHTRGEVPFDNRRGGLQFPLRHPALTIRAFPEDKQIMEGFCRIGGYYVHPSGIRTLPRRIISRLLRLMTG